MPAVTLPLPVRNSIDSRRACVHLSPPAGRPSQSLLPAPLPHRVRVHPRQGLPEPSEVQGHVLAAEVDARHQVPSPLVPLRRFRVGQHHVARRVPARQRALAGAHLVLLVRQPHPGGGFPEVFARDRGHPQRRDLGERGAPRPQEQELGQVRAVHPHERVAGTQRRVPRRERQPVGRLQDVHVEPHGRGQPRHRRLVLDHPRPLARHDPQPRPPSPPLLGVPQVLLLCWSCRLPWWLLVRVGEHLVEVDDGLVVPEPSGVHDEDAVVAGPHDGAREAVRPRAVEEVHHGVVGEAGDDLAEHAGPPGVVRDHPQHDAAAEVLHRQPRRQEPVVERVEQVAGVAPRGHDEQRRVVPYVAPVLLLLPLPIWPPRRRHTEPHLGDLVHDEALPLPRVRPHPLLFVLFRRRAVLRLLVRREQQERQRRGVRAHVAGHEAHVRVHAGAVAADGVVAHGRARGPHLVVKVKGHRIASGDALRHRRGRRRRRRRREEPDVDAVPVRAEHEDARCVE
uniref:Uncharacterized protein n=1 Tax=Zea mays TaxID=4577 RepID=A0A804QW51_MAIZE